MRYDWSITLVNEICKQLKRKFTGSGKRFLGIDFGEIRIGVALSDVERTIATPYKMLANKSFKILMPEIVNIVREMDVGAIIFGLPLQFDGTEGATAEKVRNFATFLRKYLDEAEFSDVDIAFVDESHSSQIAEEMLVTKFDMGRQKRKEILDKIAAAEILQRVLDIV